MLQELRSRIPQNFKIKTEQGVGEREYVPPTRPLATWWIQKSPGTTYVRCHVPARALPGQALALKFSDLEVHGDVVSMPRHRGVGIWQFVGNATRAFIMAELQHQGFKVLMEVDDNYLQPPPPVPGTHGDWRSKLDRTETDRYSYQAHRKIIQWVDGVICSTDTLAEIYDKATPAPVYVCPNSADLDDWEPIDKQGGYRRIGFAGSHSHYYDLALIDRALDYASRQPRVSLVKVGVGGKKWRWGHIQVPWTDDLGKYRKNLQMLDVGLCPLKRSIWHDSKSDIKAIEYTLAGALPIVQKSPPYKDWLDVVPSAGSEKEWVSQVKWAVSCPLEELTEAWERAYAFVLENKLISQHIDKWRSAL